ncbi:hypothetical protein [Microvirga sp. VF16]|uniref:hypothetical protein n=1 Tax=Microvirga sp. VF16 TaxID=2807101 RepID=UPI00193E02AF|nr:hypothetical protein [Microvirga sp. VF16]QRM27889.1 hypothetical protein JO965_16700 [Microvirga sp. VF16]
MTPMPANKVLKPRPFGGEQLIRAIELDAHCPSFLAYTLSASVLKRQSIFAALGMLEQEGPDLLAARLSALTPAHYAVPSHPMARIAQALTVMRARTIVQAVFGAAPPGLLGMLSRLGDSPLPQRRFYRLIFEMFSNPEHRQRAEALLQITGKISPSHIEIARYLDPVLMHRNILNRISLSQVDDVNATLTLIRKTVSTATDAALRQSIEQIDPKTRLETFFSRWLKKVDQPIASPQIPADDPDLTLLATGEAMVALGRRFQNCLGSKTPFVATGRHAYVHWRHSPEAIAELHRLSNGQFVLADVHTVLNQRPDPGLVAAVRSKLQSLGIPALETSEHDLRACGVLRLAGAFDIIIGPRVFGDIDEQLNELEREFADAA